MAENKNKNTKSVTQGQSVLLDALTDELGKKVAKGATTALLVASLLTGLAFSGPSEINEEQAEAHLRQTPIVMDIDDYMNSDVDDDDDADEQKGAKVGIVAKFKQAVLNLPQSVRLLIVTPLWLSIITIYSKTLLRYTAMSWTIL